MISGFLLIIWKEKVSCIYIVDIYYQGNNNNSNYTQLLYCTQLYTVNIIIIESHY